MTHATPETSVSLIPRTPGEVAKAIVYILLGVVGVLVTALADDKIDGVELILAVIALIGATPVYLLAGTAVKTIVTFLVAGLQSTALLVADGAGFADVSLSSWLVVVVTAFAAIGVAVVPNAPPLAEARVIEVHGPIVHDVSSLPNE
jgi:hypothetical protein